MCCRSCLFKSCCCGNDLTTGIKIWAVLDALFHLLLLPLPTWMSEIAPYGTYFVAWIVALVLTHVLLLIGTITSRPAFLTFWLIIFMLNLILLGGLWVLAVVGICLRATLTSTSTSGGAGAGDDVDNWRPIKPELGDISSHPLWMMGVVLSFLLLVIVPPCHLYFWIVVKSLRKRLLMEISIGFNSDRQEITTGKESRAAKLLGWLWTPAEKRAAQVEPQARF